MQESPGSLSNTDSVPESGVWSSTLSGRGLTVPNVAAGLHPGAVTSTPESSFRSQTGRATIVSSFASFAPVSLDSFLFEEMDSGDTYSRTF